MHSEISMPAFGRNYWYPENIEIPCGVWLYFCLMISHPFHNNWHFFLRKILASTRWFYTIIKMASILLVQNPFREYDWCKKTLGTPTTTIFPPTSPQTPKNKSTISTPTAWLHEGWPWCMPMVVASFVWLYHRPWSAYHARCYRTSVPMKRSLTCLGWFVGWPVFWFKGIDRVE